MLNGRDASFGQGEDFLVNFSFGKVHHAQPCLVTQLLDNVLEVLVSW
jgi:hypothetical protein